MTYAEFLQNFLGEFLKITSFAGKMRYADQNLKRLGSGSGRIVYDIDGERVFKLAKNTKGVAQNEEESGTGKYPDTHSIVTKVFESADDDSWIIAEKGKKVNEKRIKELTGISSLNDLYYYVRNFDARNHGQRELFHQEPEIVELLNENEFVQDLTNFIANYGQQPGDFGRPSSYGEVLRDGQPTIVLTDYGLTEDVYNTYYNRERKQPYRMYELYDFADGNDDILSDIGNTEEVRYGMWGLIPYSVGDGDAVMNEGFLTFVMNRDKYPKKNLQSDPYLVDMFHECVNNLKETLNHVDDKKKFYNNLLGLQEYLQSHNLYDRDWLEQEEYVINEDDTPDVKYFTLDDKNYATKLAELVSEKLNLGNVKYIGEGDNGYAFEVNNNTVLKITSDIVEADASMKLLRAKPQFIVNIYNIYKIVDTEKNLAFFAILQENIIDKPKEKFRRYFEVVNILKPNGIDIGDFFSLIRKPDLFDYNGVLEKMKPILTISPEADIPQNERNETYNFLIGLLNIRQELLKYGIKSTDYTNIGNLGYKNGVLKYFDVGGFGRVDQPNVGDANTIMLQEGDKKVIGFKRSVGDKIVSHISEKYGYESPRYVGKGTYGLAYDIGGDKIMKVTSDKSEAVESLKIKGKTMKHLADVYEVYYITPKQDSEIPESYVIILEKLKTDEPYFNKMLRRVYYVFNNILKLDFNNTIDDYVFYGRNDNEKEINQYMSKNPEDSKFYYGLLAIADEARQYGIQSTDYINSSNLGYKKNGELGFFDMGFGDYMSTPKQQPQRVEMEEDGSSRYSSDHTVGQDDFPPYNQYDTSRSLENNLYANTGMYEDLEYNHASDATKDEYIISERIMSSMPGSSTVSVKKKCRLGGLGNTSVACNQGDIKNLDIKPLKEEVIPYDAENMDDPEELGYNPDVAYEQAMKIAKDNGINILSNKDLKGVTLDNEGNVIGAFFESVDNEEYSFDVVIDKRYQGMGYGKEMVRYELDQYEYYKDAYGDKLKLNLDVVNPNMRDLLKKHFGFKDVQQTDADRFSMTMDETVAVNLPSGEVNGYQSFKIFDDDRVVGEMGIINRDNGYLTVDKIFIENNERDKGYATDAMEILFDYADKFNKIITLTPDNLWGANVNKLKKWYLSLGFVMNKGRKKDFQTMQLMYRLPKNRMNEEVDASEAYDDEDALDALIRGDKNVALIVLGIRPYLRDKIDNIEFGTIPVKQANHPESAQMTIVYRKGHEDQANRLYDVMKSHGGYVQDQTPEEAYEIGKLLDYTDESILNYLKRRYGVEEIPQMSYSMSEARTDFGDESDFMKKLNHGVDKDQMIQVRSFPLNMLTVSKRGITGAIQDIQQGRPSTTNKPVLVFYNIDNKTFLVEDGYHRVAQAYLDKVKSIPVRIYSNTWSDYVANVGPENKFDLNEGETVCKPIKITQEIKDFLLKFDSDENLLRSGGIPTELLDKAAFGFDDTLDQIMPDKLSVKWHDDLDNVKYYIKKKGLTDAEYAKRVDLSEPIDVSFDGKKFYIEDGHHRYYAAKILNSPLKMNLEIKANPIEALGPGMGYDDFHRCIWKQVHDQKNEPMNEAMLMSLQDLPFKKEIEQMGGKVHSVGGAVRDEFLGKESKDLDVLITGVPMDKLEQVLSKYGRVDAVGKSFGVLKFKPRGATEDIDIAIPRTEKPTGAGGHQGFEVTSDHALPIEKDLERRDFTINAIAKDSNGNIIDPYNGREDLKNKIIRVVNPEAFSDDPLRMLRAVQFASRFGFAIEPETMRLIQSNAQRIKEIPSERILMEFDKIIKKGNKRTAVQLLKDTGLYGQMFGFDMKQSTIDRSPFDDVQTMGEFIYLLTRVTPNPAEFYLQKFATKDAKRDSNYKEIKALELAFDSAEATTLTEARSIAHNMYGMSPQSLQSKILPDVIEVAAQELLRGDYPKTVGELAVNGNDLMAMGYKGKQVGDALKSMLLKVYSGKVKNEKQELLSSLQSNINEDVEKKPLEKVEYGALMLFLDVPVWNKITSVIKKEDVFDKPGFGIENEPHLTVLYGFHDEVTADEVFDLYKKTVDLKPIEIRIKGISIFKNPDFDVVKFDVDSKTLTELNGVMRKLPNTTKFPDYHAHITLAYVNKGEGDKYVKPFEKERVIIGNKLVFSTKDGDKKTLMLNEKGLLKEDVDGRPEMQEKQDAGYVEQTAKENEKCSNCGWFKDGKCGIVKGNVNPNGWCRLWGTKKFCNESLVREDMSDYAKEKASLMRSKAISKEMKTEILKHFGGGSTYKEGGHVHGLIKPEAMTGKSPKSSGVSMGADKDGFFVYTHRARSKSHETPDKITVKEINFIESTG